MQELKHIEDLVVVGVGIRALGHLTPEAMAHIQIADYVPFVIADPTAESLIRSLNSRSESLAYLYSPQLDRRLTYQRMVERVMQAVRGGAKVCFAVYGHPGVFAYPTHETIRLARREGYKARMLPGISAEDCLFADMGIDPSTAGCQSFEATDFLINNRLFDGGSHLILWQIGVLGEPRGVLDAAIPKGLPYLVEKLLRCHPSDHVGYLYEASVVPGQDPKIGAVKLKDLARTDFATIATLYVPPSLSPSTDWDLATRLGLS